MQEYRNPVKCIYGITGYGLAVSKTSLGSSGSRRVLCLQISEVNKDEEHRSLRGYLKSPGDEWVTLYNSQESYECDLRSDSESFDPSAPRDHGLLKLTE